MTAHSNAEAGLAQPGQSRFDGIDAAERRLNELGYKQELRREMTLFKTLAIAFSTVTLFTGIIPLYGSSLLYAGPAPLVWGWIVVSFFTAFVAIAMSEICSSFPAYAGSQTMQSIILLSTGTNRGGGYLAPRGVFLAMYMGLTIIWALLNIFSLKVIAFIDTISMWWQLIGGAVIIVMLPLVAHSTQSASYVFSQLETSPDSTGIHSKAYAIILSLIVSQYSLYGYDTAAHLTEETKGAEINGPIAILLSVGIVSVFGWALILALTFSIQDFTYLYNPNNETAGTFVPAQILYDAFHGRYHNSSGAIVLLFVIWGSFFFAGLSVTTSAARVVYAFSRDGGIPYSRIWRRLHPRYKVPRNAVWLCAVLCMLLGLPILKINMLFTAITSVSTIGWVGGYAVPIFARMIMPKENFKPGPFYLGCASRPICLIAFLWICYTCSAFLLPTLYPLAWNTFNYAPIAVGAVLGVITLWWLVDARKWFKGPVRNIGIQHDKA